MSISLKKTVFSLKNIEKEIGNINQTIFYINEYFYNDIEILTDDSKLKLLYNIDNIIKNFAKNINEANLLIKNYSLNDEDKSKIEKYIDSFNELLEINKNVLKINNESKELKEYKKYLEKTWNKNKELILLMLENNKKLFNSLNNKTFINKLKSNLLNFYEIEDKEKKINTVKKYSIEETSTSDIIENVFAIAIIIVIIGVVGKIIYSLIENINKIEVTNESADKAIELLTNVFLSKEIIGLYLFTILIVFVYKTFKTNAY